MGSCRVKSSGAESAATLSFLTGHENPTPFPDREVPALQPYGSARCPSTRTPATTGRKEPPGVLGRAKGVGAQHASPAGLLPAAVRACVKVGEEREGGIVNAVAFRGGGWTRASSRGHVGAVEKWRRFGGGVGGWGKEGKGTFVDHGEERLKDTEITILFRYFSIFLFFVLGG